MKRSLCLLLIFCAHPFLCLEIRDFLSDLEDLPQGDKDVFVPEFKYKEITRTRRDVSGSGEAEERARVPVEVRFTALGREFHFELEAASKPFTDMSHVLIRSGNETRIHGPLGDGARRQDCLLRGKSKHREKVALNFCGGIRGVVTMADDYYVINPMREKHVSRVKRGTHSLIPHVIFRKPRWRSSCPHNKKSFDRGEKSYFPRRDLKSYLLVDSEKYFPNDIAGEHGFSLKSRNYFPSEMDKLSATDGWMRRTGKLAGKYFIELAIFIDRDLFKIMAENFPLDTEEHIIQVVLAMINAVQLLYNDENLDVDVQFLIKRLEILQTDPPNLERSYNIDKYLASFCKWQAAENVAGDSDPLHWDHAVILTGLDVHVLDRDMKISSQVVGLAPVSGMCLPASSCTVNEGRHFESVYVMAHEIGHNLGMRHDGKDAGNSCSSGSFIMSPTLGSGKISWSPCSRAYLHRFLSSSQASCLSDRGPVQVTQTSDGQLPGQRFPADIQCRLRYGPDSFHSKQQRPEDPCRDLHCRREHYTWTSHPALEGTACGPGRWCRAGACVTSDRGVTSDQEHPMSGVTRVHGGWSQWSEAGGCRGPCLYSVTGSLARGSSGLTLASRACDNPRPGAGGRHCPGKNFKITSCNSVRQCMSVRKQSVADHARGACEAASREDPGLLPYGDTSAMLEHENPGAACAVSCYTAAMARVTRGLAFPDGTLCRVRGRSDKSLSFCIQGVCQEFSCASDATFALNPDVCRSRENERLTEEVTTGAPEAGAEVTRSGSGWSAWRPVSACSFTCLVPARGLQMMARTCRARVCEGVDSTLGLCEDRTTSCNKLITPFQFASQTCENFGISKLSGIGMQLTSTALDPDRACRVACQDRDYSYRFYMVSGEKGWFPYGTDCSRGIDRREAYCIKGRCLEFGSDGTPLYVPFTASDTEPHKLFRRSLIFNTTGRGRVVGSIDQKYLEQIVQDFNKTINGGKEQELTPSSSLVIFDDPIDIPGSELEEMTTKVSQKTPQDPWDDAEVSDEFLADVDVIYKKVDSGGQTKKESKAIILFIPFLLLILKSYYY